LGAGVLTILRVTCELDWGREEKWGRRGNGEEEKEGGGKERKGEGKGRERERKRE
jgi:hypothetical protein